MNVNYGIRPIDAAECIRLFGSARDAIRGTGGQVKVALFYANNPNEIPKAGCRNAPREKGPLLNALSNIYEMERTYLAARAYDRAGTIAAVMVECECGNPMAWELLWMASDLGLLTRPLKERRPKATPGDPVTPSVTLCPGCQEVT